MRNYTTTLMILLFGLNVSAQVDSIPNPPGSNATKSILRVSPDDHIWLGYIGRGAAEYDGSIWNLYYYANGLPSGNVNAFAFYNTIRWLGTDSGLVKIDGITINIYDTSNSPLPTNKINDLFMADSVLWIATDRGAVSFDGINFNIYNKTNSPLTSDTILCFNKNDFGLYISNNRDISVKTSTGWKRTYPTFPPVNKLTSDKQGNIYNYNFSTHDTVFEKITTPFDPCYYNTLVSQPYYFIGAGTDNKIYSTSYLGNSREVFIIEFDSSRNIQNCYPMDSSSVYIATNYRNGLYDFNSHGEIISTINNKPIFKTNLSGVTPFLKTDSCPYLDINMVQARVWNNGNNFWNQIGDPLYEVPKGSGKSPIFCEGLQIGGLDPQGKLHIAAQTYRQSGSDFWPGPLDTTNATTDTATLQLYNKLWKIDRFTINDFIYNFQNGSVANGSYTIPDIILNWPVHGSGDYSRSLAPFIDYNSDGIYNPHDGDYPDIKGDQMIWWVLNDNYSTHGETGSLYNLGVEIHCSAYAYTCPQLSDADSVINYTTFYHYDFINRSDTSYHNVYAGIFLDTDLGNYLDDYVGCDTSMDIGFAYNGDDTDDYGNINMYEYDRGYGANPPMINLALLKGPQASPGDGLDNNHNGIIDEPGENCMMNYFLYYNNDFTATGNPINQYSYYNYLHGIWKDGVPLTYWRTGHDTASVDYTHYMFSGPLYDTTGWSESHPSPGGSPNVPSDRRFIVSSGPFDLPSHDQRSIDYAYVYTREAHFPNGINTSVAVNRDQVMRIKHFFETDSFPCKHLVGIDEIKNEELPVTLYPNPAHSEIFVTLMKTMPGLKTFYITDLPGQIVTTQTKFYSSSFKINLSMLKPGLYFLHIQSNDKSSIRKFIVE